MYKDKNSAIYKYIISRKENKRPTGFQSVYIKLRALAHRYDSENSKSEALAREERVQTETPPPKAESEVPASVMKSATIRVSLFTMSRPAVWSDGKPPPPPPPPLDESFSASRCLRRRIFSSFQKGKEFNYYPQ